MSKLKTISKILFILIFLSSCSSTQIGKCFYNPLSPNNLVQIHDETENEYIVNFIDLSIETGLFLAFKKERFNKHFKETQCRK